jgi:triacylglycerol esterase/lipase EstA (alpha/beta hydrolase family)
MRKMWITMLAAVALVAGVVGLVARPAAAASSGTATDVYFVHGYGYGDCAQRWNTAIAAFRQWGWTGRMHTVGYYGSHDKHCSDHIASGSTNTSITTLGRDLANYLYKNYSHKGKTVDLVGHSMGGLVIRTALDGVAHHRSGFPAYLYVANAVTLDSPHQGVIQSSSWQKCHNTQCDQMRPGSAFLRALQHAPQGRGGTDWSLVGASPDQTVSWSSGVDLNQTAQHKYHYLATQPSGLAKTLSHTAIKYAVGHNRKYHLSYWNVGMKAATHTTNGWSPIYALFQSCRYATTW